MKNKLKLNEQQRLGIYKQAKADLDDDKSLGYICGILSDILVKSNYINKGLKADKMPKLFPEFKLFEPTIQERIRWDWGIFYSTWFTSANHDIERHICLDFCIAMLEQ